MSALLTKIPQTCMIVVINLGAFISSIFKAHFWCPKRAHRRTITLVDALEQVNSVTDAMQLLRWTHLFLFCFSGLTCAPLANT